MADIRDLLRERILILDGGMGTMLQRHSLSGNSEEFNISHPEIIAGIHSEYVDAGADIITTNSFNASRISQAAYGMQDRAAEFACAAARIARTVADNAPRQVFVAGNFFKFCGVVCSRGKCGSLIIVGFGGGIALSFNEACFVGNDFGHITLCAVLRRIAS